MSAQWKNKGKRWNSQGYRLREGISKGERSPERRKTEERCGRNTGRSCKKELFPILWRKMRTEKESIEFNKLENTGGFYQHSLNKI